MSEPEIMVWNEGREQIGDADGLWALLIGAAGLGVWIGVMLWAFA